MTDFAKEVQDRWKDAQEADKDNRKEAILDLEFAAGDQWDDQTRQQRERVTEDRPYPLPCLTINTVPQFIGQVIGDRRANATSIKVLPREDGDKEIAEIRSELIRSIELQSKAPRVYAQSFEQAVTCGVGNFRIDLDYAREDVFDRDLFIRAIPNPLAVLWDPMSGDPTGRDAEFCFVQDRIRHDDYRAKFKAEPTDALNVDSNGNTTGDWIDSETVRVAEFWKMSDKPLTIAMQMDGSIIDITGKKASDLLGQLAINPATQKPYLRETSCRYATRILTNGKEELDEPFELKIPRLPIIRVMGREVWIDNKRVRFGLVRFARDPQRLKNYMRSVWAQKLMSAPRHNWMGPAGAFEGRQGDFSDVLIYNDEAKFPPTPMTQNQLADFLTGAQVFAQDMKDTTGLHDASLGMRSNETSGVAIRARQGEGDNATIIYHDNMDSAQQEAGEVINALIPTVFDTPRTVRLIGQDDAVRLIRVNDEAAAQSPDYPQDKGYDLSTGRYDVQITTGTAFETKRVEAAANMMEMARAAPQIFAVAGDLIAKAQDWPGADEIAERIKRTVPPQYLGDDETNDDKDPEAAQAAAQKAQQAEQMQQAAADMEMKLKQAEVNKAEAEARKANAEADKAEAEAQQLNAEMALKGAHMAEVASMGEEDDELGDMPEGIAA